MRIRRSVLSVTALLILAGVQTVSAEDFTITVPVRVSSLLAAAPEINVACAVGAGDTSTANRIGEGMKTVAVDGSGNYSGNVEVKFNASAGRDPFAATHYACYLRLMIGGSTVSPSATASNAAAQPKAGTTLTAISSGTLPQ